MKDTSRSAGFSMRKDIVDALGIEVPEMGTYDDMYKILTQVHEAYPDMYPLVPTWSAGGMQETLPVDPLGDNMGCLLYTSPCQRDIRHGNHNAAFLPVIPAALAPEIIRGEGAAAVLFRIASAAVEIDTVSIDLNAAFRLMTHAHHAMSALQKRDKTEGAHDIPL